MEADTVVWCKCAYNVYASCWHL